MSAPEPFAGSPFTCVAFNGGDDLIVALPLDDVMHRMCDTYSRTIKPGERREREPIVFASVPVLLANQGDDVWTIELGVMRLDRVVNLTPWSAKLADTEVAGYALGEAKRARPDLFAPPTS